MSLNNTKRFHLTDRLTKFLLTPTGQEYFRVRARKRYRNRAPVTRSRAGNPEFFVSKGLPSALLKTEMVRSPARWGQIGSYTWREIIGFTFLSFKPKWHIQEIINKGYKNNNRLN